MIQLFRKNKAGRQTEALQTAISWIDNKLRIFATYLSRRTDQLQPQKVAAIIIASCLFFSVCLGFAVFRTTRDQSEIHLPAIRAPLIKPYPQEHDNDMVIERIRHFHHYLDSLRQNNYLRYDSVMKNRPHLLDSIKAVEQLINE